MDLEDEILGLRTAGDLRAAAMRAVEGYGPEVLGFWSPCFATSKMRARYSLRRVKTCEPVSVVSRAASSMRTCFYVLARHAASRLRRSPQQRAGRRVALTEVSEVAGHVRSRILPHLRSEVKDHFAAIRDALSEDDRALSVLRVDRDMRWRMSHAPFFQTTRRKERLPA